MMKLQNPLPTLLLSAMCLAALPAAAEDAPAPATTPAPAAAPPSAPPSPAAVVNMISNCYSCHGTDGRSPGSIPSLTGKNAQQALLQLKEFKSGQLAATVMTRHAKGYTDAELEALANYIGTNLK
ncbi:cytochrome c [Sulfuricaulis sp.]|jgi:sulfide dehydrogenase cytochrome subunit|uniref:c-type cytochrome n=1 Tax=Sulfuricaulis sp. TaxID=2003553 RepID=UPI00355A53BB